MYACAGGDEWGNVIDGDVGVCLYSKLCVDRMDVGKSGRRKGARLFVVSEGMAWHVFPAFLP